jgi:hypothetical protein
MAIRIPILTSFDPKGLKQANAQFAKLQTSMGSLGRNFAAAGVVIAGAVAMIGRSLNDAAESQRAFAQTEAVLKSMGTTANGTATDIANMASALQKSTAFSDEAILSGTNLLLTFKNIQNQAGAGNDIFDQTAKAMLDVARAMGTSASGEAIRLGKALNDPVKGISALTRVGIQFTDQQKAQIKALAQSGDLMGAQKIILAELQSQFGGSAAAYAQTFTGQLESMNNELNDLSEEIGFMVMPAVKGMITEFRALIPIIGPQLKAAIESVDWKALTTSVVNFTTFLLRNAEAIVKVIAAVFAINTAFKTMQVLIGISNVAIALKTWYLAQLASGMTAASIATGAFGTALKLIPFVAVAAGIGLIIAGITETDSSYRTTTPVVTSFGQEVLKTGHDAEWAADKYGVLKSAMEAIPKDIKTKITISADYNSAETRRLTEQAFGRGDLDRSLGKFDTPVTPTTSGGANSTTQTVNQILNSQGLLATRTNKAIAKGASAGLSELIASTATTKKKFQAELAKISTPEGLQKQQTRFNRTAAGQAEIAQNAAAAAAAASQAAAEMAAAQEAAARAQQEAADREAAAVAERERIFQSFADSVKNTFAGIKNSIMGAFDLTELGGSTNAITRNMEKLLTRLKSFASNVKSLAGMGLNPALLQQVISAGPMGGARLAEALVMGGEAGLSAINAGYSEFGALSSQIAQTGTESLFNREAQQTVYNINVDGGVGSGSTIGKAIVDAIKAYERTSGAVWQGA